MFNIEKLNIRIVDTFENDRSLLLEKTQIESPRLFFNGSDTKFSNLMTTELHFNLLVKTNLDGVFFHLFTSEETRYKVVLEDITDSENSNVVWSGLLLAEQFTEPYVNSNFFVNLIATDGIGVLKNSTLPVNYYQDNKNVVDVIFKCLLQTGLNLPIYFSAAIENTGFELNYIDLLVRTKTYVDKGDKKSTYDILLLVLESIGCRLFQYQNTWLCIGLNKINQSEIVFQKYVANTFLELEFIEDVTLTRNLINKKFFATPIISVVSPLKEMEVSWSLDLKKNLIPEDVVGHLPLHIDSDIEDRTLKYWYLKTNKNFVFKVWLLLLDDAFNYSSLDFNSFFNGLKALPNRSLDSGNPIGPCVYFNVFQDTITVNDLSDNFAYLDPFFVEGSADVERYASLDIEFLCTPNTGVTNQQLQDAIAEDSTDFKNHFFFAITYKRFKNQPEADEQIYLSNFNATDAPEGIYDFALSIEGGNLKGVLKLEKILLLETGYYNVRLYPAVTNALLTGLQVYTVYNFTLETASDVVVTNQRNIKYSTSESLEVFHSGTETALTDRGFIFSDAIIQGAIDGDLIPEETAINPIFYTNTPIETDGSLWYNLIIIGLSDADYLKLKNGYKLFVQQEGEVDKVELNANAFSLVDSSDFGGKAIVQYNYAAVTTGYIYIAENDALFLKINTDSTNTIDYAEHWLNKWKRAGVEESISYIEALNRIYLGCLFEYNLKIQGQYTAFLTPFDLVDFNYIGLRRYTPVMLELNLTEGLTNVTLLESKYKDVVITSDSVVDEDNGDDSDVVLNPSIVIDASAYGLSYLVFNYTIQTIYTFTDFDVVNATISAKQLTDSVANNGVPTGLEKTAVITNKTGVQTFTFPFDLTGQYGWYEVVIVQDGIVSNKEYVLIEEPAPLPTEYITLSSIYIGDIFNKNVRYSVDYVGFTPTSATQSLQEFDVETQLPVGAAIETNLNINLDQVDVVIPSSGSWYITVTADGKTSNEVSWLSIQI